jgi:chemotaxis response regulator CheB
MTYRTVLAISPSRFYLDEVSAALAEIGAQGVLVEDVIDAARALHEGFRPEVVLLDATLVADRDAQAILLTLRRAPSLAMVPVVAMPVPRSGAKAQRLDRDALYAALQKLDDASPSP